MALPDHNFRRLTWKINRTIQDAHKVAKDFTEVKVDPEVSLPPHSPEEINKIEDLIRIQIEDPISIPTEDPISIQTEDPISIQEEDKTTHLAPILNGTIHPETMAPENMSSQLMSMSVLLHVSNVVTPHTDFKTLLVVTTAHPCTDRHVQNVAVEDTLENYVKKHKEDIWVLTPGQEDIKENM